MFGTIIRQTESAVLGLPFQLARQNSPLVISKSLTSAAAAAAATEAAGSFYAPNTTRFSRVFVTLTHLLVSAFCSTPTIAQGRVKAARLLLWW